uniref:Uncharacterized protein n=1 Tax=Rhizophora mucronata TaxID=61149 RepID=A0A2P2JDV5_RHIMU
MMAVRTSEVYGCRMKIVHVVRRPQPQSGHQKDHACSYEIGCLRP